MIDRNASREVGAWPRPAQRRRLAGMGLFGAAGLLWAGASFGAPYSYVARAQLTEVKPYFVSQGSPDLPGAGVRAFQPPQATASGVERFEIRWYAHPPGIPPGTVILLESRQERAQLVRNHVLRTTDKSEGYIRSVIDVPAEDVRQAGRVVSWRVRIVWRGQVLSSRDSGNWEG